MPVRTLSIKNIIVDPRMQIRVLVRRETVKEYMEDMTNGAEFPPITVFEEGKKIVLVDGFHRFSAAQELGLTKIRAEVLSGNWREAILHAVSANSTHGLRRTNEDKRKAVGVLLNDAEWSQWTDRAIARKTGVSNTFVSNMRKELASKELVSKETVVEEEEEEEDFPEGEEGDFNRFDNTCQECQKIKHQLQQMKADIASFIEGKITLEALEKMVSLS